MERPLDRAFLDADVLFSAAYRRDSRLRELWNLPDVELLPSHYAVEEARRNLSLSKPENLADMEPLVAKLALSRTLSARPSLQEELCVELKDRPILAAIEMEASHLLTGDKLHFGHLFGKRVKGVAVLTPAMYWRSRKDRGG